jgi:Transglycosylase-like domain
MRRRSRALLVLAVAVAVVPPAAQAAESAADPPPPPAVDARAAGEASLRPGQPVRPRAARIPHRKAFACIAEHESGGRWDISTGNGYYGGLQMDLQFQRTYAPRLYASKGTADNWTREEQMRAAGRAVRSRGFTPWPTTARTCGLL